MFSLLASLALEEQHNEVAFGVGDDPPSSIWKSHLWEN